MLYAHSKVKKKLIKDYKKFLTYDKKKCTLILNSFINQFYS